ncbi:3-oxoacyl-[acyl-carrier-protein] synthase 2 [Paenibacillus tyrfis]|uniref:beta-ketoacyl synthase N-terminal-like domain-containing protein n=1 Tax=Paenibacillus tyrfis TaxID=1501230 RepID=UPI0024920E93|nr:beta-ketoacyl synthase N-terminal-like domain-containing protein [Paenibacillus tyrfis]GLI08241.1 3-oxoacyl-[acyl-carrier-protein] synthase 2 [Paenibacillus tyrfis]
MSGQEARKGDARRTPPFRAVVTGTGLAASSGFGEDQIWEAVLHQRSPVTSRTYETGVGGSVRYPVYGIDAGELRARLTESERQAMAEWGLSGDVDLALLIVTIREALRSAGLDPDSAGREGMNLSLVIGHENLGTVFLVDRLLRSGGIVPSGPDEALPSFRHFQDSFFHIQTFPYLFYLARLFGVNGLTYTVNNACASGLYALELGRQLLASGSTDVVIVACSDYAHVTEYLWLQDKGALSKKHELRPFDRKRDGSILGDGAGALVLESADRAARRGADAVCEYAGGSFGQDNWSLTLPDVSRHTYSSVIADAVARWGGAGADLLVPHGAGSPLWDRYEAAEIRRSFAQLSMATPLVTAFKGYLGHTLGASAMLEMLLMLRCMKEGLVPPTLHYEESGAKIELPVAAAWEKRDIRTAVKAVPAYGGFHAACVFKTIDLKEEYGGKE